jgi:hypothetical protein
MRSEFRPVWTPVLGGQVEQNAETTENDYPSPIQVEQRREEWLNGGSCRTPRAAARRLGRHF